MTAKNILITSLSYLTFLSSWIICNINSKLIFY